jgi:dihydropyrimidinase
MLDLVIRNGEVVTPQGVGRWTVGISGEQIAYVGIDDPPMQAGRTIDAAGKIVVPGGIEPHAHLDIFDLTNPDSGRSTLGPEC